MSQVVDLSHEPSAAIMYGRRSEIIANMNGRGVRRLESCQARQFSGRAMDQEGKIYERLLQLLQKEPRRARTVRELAALLGQDEKTIRNSITVQRRNRHNVRNKRRVGFWLEDGRAPTLSIPGTGDDRWQGEPPLG